MNQNWDIAGHTWVVDYFRRSIRADAVAHAYLLAGPAGIGKATLARRFAQALLCEQDQGDPCLQCRACKRIAHGNHPDVRTVSLATQAAGQKSDEPKSREVRIDTVRAWQGDVDLRPFEAARRVFILDDADKLNEQAANAMLKTLEEPPPYAVLILLAHGAGDLLPTIVSRCRTLRLRPLARADVAEALRTTYNVEPTDAELLAAWSGGRVGWAISAVDEPEMLEQQQVSLDALVALRTGGRVPRLKWAEERAKEYSADPSVVQGMLLLWETWWRDVLLTAGGCGDAITYLDRRDELVVISGGVALPDVYTFLRHIDSTRQQLAENVNPQLALENLALHLP